MRRLLGLAVIVVVVIATIGYFRGWFHIATNQDEGNTHINVTVNNPQMKKDAHEAESKIKQGVKEGEQKLRQEVDH